MHLFLAPHLDDAVLSCGGLINRLVKSGQTVQILTVFAGDPPTPLPDTPLIRDLHQRWRAGESPYATRREEDRQAAAVLGAQVRHLDMPDCPYRTDENGKPLYSVNDDLFGAVHPADPALGRRLELPQATVYVPLGAGGHIDHQVVVRLARDVAAFFYEEYPYSADSGEAARLAPLRYGSAAVQDALGRLGGTAEARLIGLDAEDIAKKVAAIACYRSQISTFWDSLQDMETHVRQYARQVDPSAPQGAERLWVWRERSQ